jgi:hypothetical protein
MVGSSCDIIANAASSLPPFGLLSWEENSETATSNRAKGVPGSRLVAAR